MAVLFRKKTTGKVSEGIKGRKREGRFNARKVQGRGRKGTERKSATVPELVKSRDGGRQRGEGEG